MESSFKGLCVTLLFVSAAAVAGPFDAIKQVTRGQFFQDNGNGEKSMVQNPDSLLMEFGPEMLTPNYIFGGVITAVVDPTHEDMGNLKASKFPTLQARLNYNAAQQVLEIRACIQNCQDPTSYMIAYEVPVLKNDPLTNRITVDFAKISEELDIVGYWTQAMGMQEEHQKLGSRVTYVDNLNVVDNSRNTLIFEIQSDYHRALAQSPYDYSVKTRWYLKQANSFTQGFVPRFPTDGIGYFQTTPNIQPVTITRYSLDKPVFFFIKNVPPRYRPAFKEALEDWNRKLEPTLKTRVINYKFLEKSDPLFDKVVTGDVRYSVIEWDMDNVATYGGLGPSVANPVSGETFSSVVWIQGPTIEKMYQAWFGVQDQITAAQKSVNSAKITSDLLAKFYRSLPASKQRVSQSKDETFDFPALRPELYDPLFSRDDFDLPPQNYDYDKYMYGYFVEMVSHEVGHNLGLRHNFRGNLQSDNSGNLGTMSSSVMEYLGRPFRYLDRIGPYDKMAINYGYLGTAPAQRGWYCTDEDQFSSTNPTNSPECSSSDATNDPFAYQSANLQRIYTDLVGVGTPTTSAWTMADLQGTMVKTMDGILGYAVSAPFTSSRWTNFSRNGQRPTDPTLIENYVLSSLQKELCPANEASFITQKLSSADQAATRQKIADYRKTALAILDQYKDSAVIASATALKSCLTQTVQ